MAKCKRSDDATDEFGRWIPAFAGMTGIVRLPCEVPAAVAGPGGACYNRPALAPLPSTYIPQARRTQGVGQYVVAFQPPEPI